MPGGILDLSGSLSEEENTTPERFLLTFLSLLLVYPTIAAAFMSPVVIFHLPG